MTHLGDAVISIVERGRRRRAPVLILCEYRGRTLFAYVGKR